MMRNVLFCIGAICACALTAPGLSAQEEPPVQERAADSTELVFEREVFSYPGYSRRDPFLALLDAAAGGPRFEELQLLGVVHHTNSNLSVVLFGVGDVAAADQATVSEDGAGGGGGGEDPFETYRMRRGDVIGNTRILEIHENRVVVEVEEFGLAERRVLELPRADEGGPS